MKQNVGMPVVIAIIVVVVVVVGYFAFKTFAPPSMTGAGGGSPYAGRPDMKGGPASSGPPAGGSSGHMSGGPGSGGPMSGGPTAGSAGGPPR